MSKYKFSEDLVSNESSLIKCLDAAFSLSSHGARFYLLGTSSMGTLSPGMEVSDSLQPNHFLRPTPLNAIILLIKFQDTD